MQKIKCNIIESRICKPGDYHFSVLSGNVHYLFLFKSPRNSSKKIHLGEQVSPFDNKIIVRSYREDTSSEFTYLLFDFIKKLLKKVAYDQKYFPVKGQ